MKKTLIASAMAVGIAFGAQAKGIVDTAVGAGTFKTLAAALTAAGLIDTLKGPGPFTVFAPTDAAFAKTARQEKEGFLFSTKAITASLWSAVLWAMAW